MEMCSSKQIWGIWNHPGLRDLLRGAVLRWLWAGSGVAANGRHRPGSPSQHRRPGPPGSDLEDANLRESGLPRTLEVARQPHRPSCGASGSSGRCGVEKGRANRVATVTSER